MSLLGKDHETENESFGPALGVVIGIRLVVRSGNDRDGNTIICDIEDACAAVLTVVTIDSSGTDVSDVNLLVIFGVGQEAPPVENE